MKNFAKILGINVSKTNPEPEIKNNIATLPPDEPPQKAKTWLDEMKEFESHAETNLNQPDEQASALAELKPLETEDGEVKKSAVAAILPNPFQPRKTFNQESLDELAASIKEYGIIQPLIVRPIGDTYQLIAGERRLRASKLAGLAEVPIIVRYITDKEMAELAMIENLQREDLHFLEEAEGFAVLIANFDITQEALAKRMGKSQSFIANKLRLLKLSDRVRKELFDQRLTERHARAILKIDNEKTQLEILEVVSKKRLNVKQTEEFIENYLGNISREKSAEEIPKQKLTKIIKDVRIFINTINSVASQMKKNGMDIDYKQDFDGDYITITMQIKNTRR